MCLQIIHSKGVISKFFQSKDLFGFSFFMEKPRCDRGFFLISINSIAGGVELLRQVYPALFCVG